jgi:hypothetical protein
MGHAEAPQIPEVTDEAGDSPKWVPRLGVGLFVLAVALILLAHRSSESAGDEAPTEAPTAEAAPAE